MRVLFLNLWDGELSDALRLFLDEQRDIEVFCFQEFRDADDVLPEFLRAYQKFTVSKQIAARVNYSQAVYVHPSWRVDNIVELMRPDPEIGLALGLRVSLLEKSYEIINVQGTPRALQDGVWQVNDDKKDFPARLRQSQTLREFAQKQIAPIVMGGDFNVSPDSESIEIFRRAGYQDLIRDYKIATTRNHFSWERYVTKHFYSDYVFLSPELTVKNFIVPNVEVSDHLPLILEIA